MTVFTPEQLVAAQKSNAVTLFALTNQAFDAFQKLTELNIQTARSALTESETSWREVLSGKTPEEFIAWRTKQMQPVAERALSYSRQLADIGSQAYAGWVNAACAQYAQHRDRFA
jgi:phasin family protein